VADDEAREIRQSIGLVSDRRYVVFVGTIEPRKGIEHLVRAVARRNDLDLVVVGAQGWGKIDIRAVAIAARLAPDRLIVTGAVHDVTVASIVQGASVLALPSMAEGFGLPLIEAMRLGTPVVHSNDAALLEVGGQAGIAARILDGTALHFDDIEDELNRALDEALDRRTELIAAGRERATEFTWALTAARVLRIHRELTPS
jgi:glycosyltransferase involved in cell wall biosynthesis